ncbi:hypothetical protein [Paenibacillus etheri]|nr:hypothetical protein [Paenibacillus etheri]
MLEGDVTSPAILTENNTLEQSIGCEERMYKENYLTTGQLAKTNGWMNFR